MIKGARAGQANYFFKRPSQPADSACPLAGRGRMRRHHHVENWSPARSAHNLLCHISAVVMTMGPDRSCERREVEAVCRKCSKAQDSSLLQFCYVECSAGRKNRALASGRCPLLNFSTCVAAVWEHKRSHA